MGLADSISRLGLDTVHEKPQYLDQIPNWEDCEIRPNLPIHESSNSIQFIVGGQNDPNFLIPSTMEFCAVVEVRNQDESRIKQEDEISMVNLFPHALFEAVNVYLNNKQISDTGRNYHHKGICQINVITVTSFYFQRSSQITLALVRELKQKHFKEIIFFKIIPKMCSRSLRNMSIRGQDLF